MIAHVGGAPAEEILPLVVSSVGAGVLLARAWLGSRLRRSRRAERDRDRRSADVVAAD